MIFLFIFSIFSSMTLSESDHRETFIREEDCIELHSRGFESNGKIKRAELEIYNKRLNVDMLGDRAVISFSEDDELSERYLLIVELGNSDDKRSFTIVDKQNRETITVTHKDLQNFAKAQSVLSLFSKNKKISDSIEIHAPRKKCSIKIGGFKSQPYIMDINSDEVPIKGIGAAFSMEALNFIDRDFCYSALLDFVLNIDASVLGNLGKDINRVLMLAKEARDLGFLMKLHLWQQTVYKVNSIRDLDSPSKAWEFDPAEGDYTPKNWTALLSSFNEK